ncbi:hypothetical protein DFH06DRAFT_1297330 [Mycena polygramma]|nr:hypothetical protein DFH06DRAFT_1297330 [Mycena polygramma]
MTVEVGGILEGSSVFTTDFGLLPFQYLRSLAARETTQILSEELRSFGKLNQTGRTPNTKIAQEIGGSQVSRQEKAGSSAKAGTRYMFYYVETSAGWAHLAQGRAQIDQDGGLWFRIRERYREEEYDVRVSLQAYGAECPGLALLDSRQCGMKQSGDEGLLLVELSWIRSGLYTTPFNSAGVLWDPHSRTSLLEALGTRQPKPIRLEYIGADVSRRHDQLPTPHYPGSADSQNAGVRVRGEVGRRDTFGSCESTLQSTGGNEGVKMVWCTVCKNIISTRLGLGLGLGLGLPFHLHFIYTVTGVPVAPDLGHRLDCIEGTTRRSLCYIEPGPGPIYYICYRWGRRRLSGARSTPRPPIRAGSWASSVPRYPFLGRGFLSLKLATKWQRLSMSHAALTGSTSTHFRCGEERRRGRVPPRATQTEEDRRRSTPFWSIITSASHVACRMVYLPTREARFVVKERERNGGLSGVVILTRRRVEPSTETEGKRERRSFKSKIGSKTGVAAVKGFGRKARRPSESRPGLQLRIVDGAMLDMKRRRVEEISPARDAAAIPQPGGRGKLTPIRLCQDSESLFQIPTRSARESGGSNGPTLADNVAVEACIGIAPALELPPIAKLGLRVWTEAIRTGERFMDGERDIAGQHARHGGGRVPDGTPCQERSETWSRTIEFRIVTSDEELAMEGHMARLAHARPGVPTAGGTAASAIVAAICKRDSGGKQTPRKTEDMERS